MNLERLTTPNIVHDGSMQMSLSLSPSGNCLGNDQVGMQTNVSRSATNISWWAEDLPQIGGLCVYFASLSADKTLDFQSLAECWASQAGTTPPGSEFESTKKNGCGLRFFSCQN